MIKKILSAMMLVALAIIAVSCGNDHDKKTREITEALSTHNFEKVSQLCDELYDQLPDCSVNTLGDMTVSYITLAVVGSANNDEDATVDAMRRAVTCYDMAMKKDESVAKKMWTAMAAEKNDSGFSIDPTEVINMFRTNLAAYDSSASASIEPDSIKTADELAVEEATALSEN